MGKHEVGSWEWNYEQLLAGWPWRQGQPPSFEEWKAREMKAEEVLAMYRRLRQDRDFDALLDEYLYEGTMKLDVFEGLVRDMALDLGADEEMARRVAREASIPF